MENNQLVNNDQNLTQNNMVNTPQDPGTARANRNGRGKAAKIIALVLCCSLTGGVTGAGATVLAAGFTKDNGTEKEQALTEASTVFEGQREASILNVFYVDTESE